MLFFPHFFHVVVVILHKRVHLGLKTCYGVIYWSLFEWGLIFGSQGDTKFYEAHEYFEIFILDFEPIILDFEPINVIL